MLQLVIHYSLHFLVPGIIAWVFFKENWKKVWLVLLATMLVDLDHLLSNPIYLSKLRSDFLEMARSLRRVRRMEHLCRRSGSGRNDKKQAKKQIVGHRQAGTQFGQYCRY